MDSGLHHTAFLDDIVICLLILVGACSAFCGLHLVAIACLLLLVVLLALFILTMLAGCACGALSTVGHDRHLSLSVMPWLLCGLSVQACSQAALTPEGHFLLSLIV